MANPNIESNPEAPPPENASLEDILSRFSAPKSETAAPSDASMETVVDQTRQEDEAARSGSITIFDVENIIPPAQTDKNGPEKNVAAPRELLKENFQETLTVALNELYASYSEKLSGFHDRKRLDWELCGHGIFSEADLLRAYAGATGLSMLEEDELGELERFPNIAYDFLNSRYCLPIRWDSETVDLAVCEPYTTSQLSYLFYRLYGKVPRFFLGRRSFLERLIYNIYSPEAVETKNQDDLLLQEFGEQTEETLRNMASEAKIVRLVNEMFSRAVEVDASDIHIEPEEKELKIRFRIDGILHEAMNPPLTLYPAIASRVKLIGGLNIAERRLPQDGRTDVQIGRSTMDIRISTVPSMNGESVVLRLLRKDAMVFDLKNVGMGDVMRAQFEKLVELPNGIILVVGPTGSGKSTTLYSVMGRINSPDKKIITIEDPVEYRTAGLTQIQVNPKVGLDFANGLRSIVRQDPDVILVGEIRDVDTAKIAINAALTGHLVFSTLHTNDAPGAVSRLLDMGVEGFLISSSLAAVLSQRLVRRVCSECHGVGKRADSGGAKCKRCGGSGFKGRMGIFELMVINDEIRALINRNADSGTIAKAAIKNGMLPLIEDGMMKVAEGVTTKEEVLGVAINA